MFRDSQRKRQERQAPKLADHHFFRRAERNRYRLQNLHGNVPVIVLSYLDTVVSVFADNDGLDVLTGPVPATVEMGTIRRYEAAIRRFESLVFQNGNCSASTISKFREYRLPYETSFRRTLRLTLTANNNSYFSQADRATVVLDAFAILLDSIAMNIHAIIPEDADAALSSQTTESRPEIVVELANQTSDLGRIEQHTSLHAKMVIEFLTNHVEFFVDHVVYIDRERLWATKTCPEPDKDWVSVPVGKVGHVHFANNDLNSLDGCCAALMDSWGIPQMCTVQTVDGVVVHAWTANKTFFGEPSGDIVGRCLALTDTSDMSHVDMSFIYSQPILEPLCVVHYWTENNSVETKIFPFSAGGRNYLYTAHRSIR